MKAREISGKEMKWRATVAWRLANVFAGYDTGGGMPPIITDCAAVAAPHLRASIIGQVAGLLKGKLQEPLPTMLAMAPLKPSDRALPHEAVAAIEKLVDLEERRRGLVIHPASFLAGASALNLILLTRVYEAAPEIFSHHIGRQAATLGIAQVWNGLRAAGEAAQPSRELNMMAGILVAASVGGAAEAYFAAINLKKLRHLRGRNAGLLRCGAEMIPKILPGQISIDATTWTHATRGRLLGFDDVSRAYPAGDERLERYRRIAAALPAAVIERIVEEDCRRFGIDVCIVESRLSYPEPLDCIPMAREWLERQQARAGKPDYLAIMGLAPGQDIAFGDELAEALKGPDRLWTGDDLNDEDESDAAPSPKP
jgi:hypothetical protein